MAEQPAIAVREQTGVNAGRVHTLTIGRHVIGRDPTATIQLASTDVSRQHALLEVAADAITVSDLGSKNGVHLKRKGGTTRLTVPTRLTDGAVLDVGGIDGATGLRIVADEVSGRVIALTGDFEGPLLGVGRGAVLGRRVGRRRDGGRRAARD
mgnify:CR=1 FL=1